MRRLILFVILVTFALFILSSGVVFGKAKLKGSVWNEPKGHFKVTIPEGFVFKEELPFSKGNPVIKVYQFKSKKNGVKEFLILWWEDKSVHNFSTLDERVKWNIDFFKQNNKGGDPITGPFIYKKGKYWVQKDNQYEVLFFLTQDPDGNFVGFEYWKALSLGVISDIPKMLKYLSSFKF